MTDKSPIIEKIKKLLALAASSNEHEAALAASHAQRLLAAHNLALADIEARHKPGLADRVETSAAKNLPKWVRHLSGSVSAAFDCQAIHHPATGKLTFIGVGADVQVAAYTFAFLERTIRRLCSQYMKCSVIASTPSRQRELMRLSYYLGAVSTVTVRLREQKAQTPVTPGALVPLKEGLIKQAMQELVAVRTIRSRKSYINSDAYTRGQADGKKVGIHQALGAGGKPERDLGAALTPEPAGSPSRDLPR